MKHGQKLPGIFALTLVLLFSGSLLADKNWRQNGNSKAAEMARSGGSCVEETAFMRRNHFELILHQRDITVHQGVRETDHALHGCVSCHANKDDSGNGIPVNAEDEFCAGCHEYTAVTIDCFSCHNTVPNNPTQAARK